MSTVAVIGATGCVGQALIPALLTKNKWNVKAAYRGKVPSNNDPQFLKWQQVNLHDPVSLDSFLKDVDCLYYLVHSLDQPNFAKLDANLALLVGQSAKRLNVKKIIYLGGFAPQNSNLSDHLQSRSDTGLILASCGITVTEVRAGIILDKSSVSFKMMQAILRYFPVILAPKGLNSRVSPIGLKDVINALIAAQEINVKGHARFDIGSSSISYKALLQIVAKNLYHKRIFLIPGYFIPTWAFSLVLSIISGISWRLILALMGSLSLDAVFSQNDFYSLTGQQPESIEVVLNKMQIIV